MNPTDQRERSTQAPSPPQAASRNGEAAPEFAAVMDRYESPLLRYVGQVLGPRCPENEDVVQEAFIRLHRHVTGRGWESIRHVSTWLYRVAHNLAIDAMRRRKTRHERGQGEEVRAELDRRSAEGPRGLDAVADLSRREACEAAMAELHDLPESQRTAITLKVLEGMTMKQIGEVLDTTPSNVCYHLNQGLAELSRRLKRKGLV